MSNPLKTERCPKCGGEPRLHIPSPYSLCAACGFMFDTTVKYVDISPEAVERMATHLEHMMFNEGATYRDWADTAAAQLRALCLQLTASASPAGVIELLRPMKDFDRQQFIDVILDAYCANCGSDAGFKCFCQRDD